ncbi:hypothetical protein F66182_11058 [Fusarium sp. NRRL 66182]|nr:hypothetical protein F66182_11058 [Fusarium sp. NRRL 66182]
MAISDVDKHLWLAYCKAVQNVVGGLPGHKPALFFTKHAQKAPVASTCIDPAYTNYGINNIINNLLQTDDLFYDPSHHKTYAQCLLEYLMSVKLGDDEQPQIAMTGRSFTGALDQALRERDHALEMFEKEEGHGLTGEQDFAEWWPSHAPAYSAAKQKVEAVAADYQASLLSLLDKDRTPHAITHVPEFMSSQYTSQIEYWMNGVGDGDSSVPINVADGKQVNESDFGHAAADGFSYGPWLSFSAGEGSANEEGLSFDSVDTDTNLDVQFSYDEIQTISVPAGEWNVPSPGRRYQLASSASEESRKLAFPDYMIVVRNLGFKVSIRDDKLAGQLDDMFEQAKSAGGAVRVFGIPATPDGNAEQATEENAHVAEWDRVTGLLSVRPTADAGFASVVALVGELNIS